MVKRTGPTNLQLKDLIEELNSKSRDCNLWKRVAKDLNKPTRQRRIVNLYKINKCAKDGETILVPGKVLSVGDIDRKVVVAAYQFSDLAKEKILKNNGTIMSISELITKNPEGKKVRILG
ncbi:50S ribosomal protein L18e [archaeon]|jgi:large subunit ribosomal protein L18e|nr:50S ribosomal protein L18e [archaeon]MBT6868901.1 50S ribosomal protein L18e [archaeon]MBT7192878.1 50S ribosomal protein L18e [archaeon]MBT7380844.1 50S ribosomal protein L18e [archaeon]MBT7507599.1 50S ribosomal protein L18e [archaeon]